MAKNITKQGGNVWVETAVNQAEGLLFMVPDE